MKFLRFLTHIFVAVFVCIVLCAQPLHAYIYQAQTWERPKFDERNNPVLDKNGKQIYERLHVFRDQHQPWLLYAKKQVADVLSHALKYPKSQVYLTTEDTPGEESPLSPTNNYAKNLHMHESPAYHGFLHGINHGFARHQLPRKNIEFRGPLNKTWNFSSTGASVDTVILNDHSIQDAVGALVSYTQETESLKKSSGVLTPKTAISTARLQQTLKPYNKKTVYDAYDGYKLEDILVLSHLKPTANPMAFAVKACWNFLEQRAIIESCRRDATTTQRYISMGGAHIININSFLERNGWRVLKTSGISENERITNIKSSTYKAVDLKNHFKSLPTKCVNPIKSFYGSYVNKMVDIPEHRGGFPIKRDTDHANIRIVGGVELRPEIFTYLRKGKYSLAASQNTVKIKISPQQ